MIALLFDGVTLFMLRALIVCAVFFDIVSLIGLVVFASYLWVTLLDAQIARLERARRQAEIERAMRPRDPTRLTRAIGRWWRRPR